MAVIGEARTIGRPAVFLDKDGTLVENVPYNVDPDQIRLLPDAGEAVTELSRLGFGLVVVSNQSGVARGLFDEADLLGVRRRLGELLAEYGVELDGFYACPHHPEGAVEAYVRQCDCRKPRPGLLRRAASDLAIDLAHSWMVGDILDDVEAGRRAGCRAVLLDNGGETEWLGGECRQPDWTAREWKEVVAAVAAAKPRADRSGTCGGDLGSASGEEGSTWNAIC